MNAPAPDRTADPARIRPYLTDESASFRGHATELILPATESEVADALRTANAARTPVTISAAGTSITGSRVPTLGGAVLSIERMTAVQSTPPPGFEPVESAGYRILLDRDRKLAIAPPAITLTALDAILARFGLLYPPDPTEMSAMLGGTIATNASGARSFHYGPTRAWVRRLRVVLPTGEIAELRRGVSEQSAVSSQQSAASPQQSAVSESSSPSRPASSPPSSSFRVTPRSRSLPTVHCLLLTAHSLPCAHAPMRPCAHALSIPLPDPADYPMPRIKNAAGLFLAPGMEPIDLFIGSEGILGVVTEIEVALTDRIEQTLTVLAFFHTCDEALDFVDASSSDDPAHNAGLDFLSLEYFDHRSLDFLRPKYPDIPTGATALRSTPFDKLTARACRGQGGMSLSNAAVLFELPYSRRDPQVSTGSTCPERVEGQVSTGSTCPVFDPEAQTRREPVEGHSPYPDSELLAALRRRLARFRSVTHWAVPASRREDIRLFRHALPEAVNDYVRTRAGKIGSDMAVPHDRFREMIDAYEREAAEARVPFLMFGHIGDDHLHLNFLPENADDAARAKFAYSELARIAVSLGGTVSAEHGVGKKTIFDESGRTVPYLMIQYGLPGLRAIAAVKNALDPNHILNLGNMIPPEMLDE